MITNLELFLEKKKAGNIRSIPPELLSKVDKVDNEKKSDKKKKKKSGEESHIDNTDTDLGDMLKTGIPGGMDLNPLTPW